MVLAIHIVGIVLIVALLVTVYSSVHVVDAGNVEALLVFGQVQRVLRPGLHFVPPFVSKTYPIDPETLTVDTGDERVSLPDEYEDELRDAAGGRDVDDG